MTQVFAFGRFRFDAGIEVLLAEGHPVRIGRRAARLLHALLKRPGEVISKSELIDAAWPQTAIEESNLSVQVATLRKALGAKPGGGAWIATVPGVGYRFMPLVGIEVPHRRIQMPTLLVMAFTQGGEQVRRCARHLGDDLVVALSRFQSLKLLEQNGDSVRGAGYQLRGTLRVSGAEVRIGVRLVAMGAGHTVWARSFDARMSGDGGIEHGLVDALAVEIEAEVGLAEVARQVQPEHDPADAHGLYLRALGGMRSSTPEDYGEAARLLDSALQIEPDNGALLAAACDARHHRIAMGWPGLGNDDDHVLCREYGYRGLRLDYADAGALSLFGASIYRTEDPDQGLAVVNRAVDLNPNDLTALVYAGTVGMHWGNTDAAEGYYRRALALAPSDTRQSFVFGGLGRLAMMQGDFEGALGWARQGLAVRYGYGANHWTIIAANALLGHELEAATGLARFRTLQPGVSVDSIRRGQRSREARMLSTLEGLEMAGLETA